MESLYNDFSDFGKDLVQQQVESKDLIKQNILDKRARNLMVISDHVEILSLRFIEDVCNELRRPYQIFYGSDFE